jgi:hypothetical protein
MNFEIFISRFRNFWTEIFFEIPSTSFRVDIHQKIKIFGLYVKYPKKISLEKKLFFRSKFMKLGPKNVFDVFWPYL